MDFIKMFITEIFELDHIEDKISFTAESVVIYCNGLEDSL